MGQGACLALAAVTAEAAPPVLHLAEVSIGIGVRTVVEGLDLEIGRGEIVALTGESGAGKSLTGLGIMGLLPPGGWLTGHCAIHGNRLDPMDARAMRSVRGVSLGMVFQDPVAALDPVMTIGAQLVETIRQHHRLRHDEAEAQAADLLASVELDDPESRLRRYPHQLSGGECQRVMLALALAGNPALLIADEPTTALDSATQAGILALLRRLVQARGMAVLLISHDLDAVAEHADRIAVLYAGRIVETGPSRRLIAAPRHPYTTALVTTRLTGATLPQTPLPVMAGPAPRPEAYPPGCRFHPRCPRQIDRCRHEAPAWSGPHHDGLACWVGSAP